MRWTVNKKEAWEPVFHWNRMLPSKDDINSAYVFLISSFYFPIETKKI